jgi:hypothetical protein
MYKRLVMLAMLAIASPAWAAMSYYSGPSGESAFNDDIISRGITIGSLLTFSDAASSGIVFGASNGSVDSSGLYNAINATDSLLIDVPSNVYGIGIYLSKPVAIVPSNWNYPGGSLSISAGGQTFFGVISGTPLTSLSQIQLSAQASAALVVNTFFLGTAATNHDSEMTPEPSSAALLGGSLIALAVMVRKKKRQADLRQASEQ